MSRTSRFGAMLVSIFSITLGCAATTILSSTTPGLEVQLNQEASVDLDGEARVRLPTTTFGQYHFEVRRAGDPIMHGLVPLKFNGGYLALDILFFAPATFFNLREVFPQYEFDPKAGVIRYRRRDADPWVEYEPTEAEVRRAASYFRNPPPRD